MASKKDKTPKVPKTPSTKARPLKALFSKIAPKRGGTGTVRPPK